MTTARPTEDTTVAFERAVRLDRPPLADPVAGAAAPAEPPAEPRSYTGRPRLPLPAPETSELFARRWSCRTLTGPVTAAQVAAVLGTAVRARPERPESRPYPSAGARTTVEWYAAVCRADGVAPGVYHYDPHAHALDVLDEDDPSAVVAEVLEGQPFDPLVPPLLLIASAVFPRSQASYGARGHRYAYLEAGAAAMAVDLAAGSAGLRCCWIGGFPDRPVAELIGVDLELQSEAPVITVAVG